LLVAGFTRWCRRPAVRHGLWLVVLLKLLVPPFVSIPVPGPVGEVTPTNFAQERTVPTVPIDVAAADVTDMPGTLEPDLVHLDEPIVAEPSPNPLPDAPAYAADTPEPAVSWA